MSGIAASAPMSSALVSHLGPDNETCRGRLDGIIADGSLFIQVRMEDMVYEVPAELEKRLRKLVGQVIVLGFFEGQYLIARSSRWST